MRSKAWQSPKRSERAGDGQLHMTGSVLSARGRSHLRLLSLCGSALNRPGLQLGTQHMANLAVLTLVALALVIMLPPAAAGAGPSADTRFSTSRSLHQQPSRFSPPLPVAAQAVAGASQVGQKARMQAVRQQPDAPPAVQTVPPSHSSSNTVTRMLQATAAAAAVPAQRALAQQPGTRAGAAAATCPPGYVELSAGGCPCTLQARTLRGLSSPHDNDHVALNVCPAGYRCSPSAAAAILKAGWQQGPGMTASTSNLSASFARSGRFAHSNKGICMPCQIGEGQRALELCSSSAGCVLRSCPSSLLLTTLPVFSLVISGSSTLVLSVCYVVRGSSPWVPGSRCGQPRWVCMHEGRLAGPSVLSKLTAVST